MATSRRCCLSVERFHLGEGSSTVAATADALLSRLPVSLSVVAITITPWRWGRLVFAGPHARTYSLGRFDGPPNTVDTRLGPHPAGRNYGNIRRLGADTAGRSDHPANNYSRPLEVGRAPGPWE